MKIVFHHLEGSRKGKMDVFQTQRIRIGRDPTNDLLFDPYIDRDASGFHAEVFFDDSKAWIKDLGSTNGTFVNGNRVEKEQIQANDIVTFGRRGPKMKVGEIDPGGAPEPAKEGELVDRGGAPRVGTKTMRLMVQQAMEKARERGGVAGGTLFLREMVRQSVKESSVWMRRAIAVLVILFVAACGVIAFLVYDMNRRDAAHRKALEEKEREMEVQRTELLTSIRQTHNEQESDFERRLEIQREEHEGIIRKYTAELEKARKGAMGDREKIARLERLLARIQSSESLFKEIQKKADPSIVLIFVQFKVKKTTGEEKLMGGFGTGFIVSREGYVITNKHVVEPWKFSHMAFTLKEKGYERSEEKPLLAAWLSQSRVYALKDGKTKLNFDGAYDNREGGRLSLVKAARDRMCWVVRSEGDGDEERVRKVWAHEPADNNDIALLRIRDDRKRFTPVPLMNEADFRKLEKLDRVMVLGFPRGGSILERGVAETSPALGHVRKIEKSIHISAPITQGNSGGPVFAQTGEVIGISTRMIKDVETYGFCIPVAEARKLLASVR
jgi:S1-C subfamily serine protease